MARVGGAWADRSVAIDFSFKRERRKEFKQHEIPRIQKSYLVCFEMDFNIPEQREC